MLKSFLLAHDKGKETPGWRNHNLGHLLVACTEIGLTVTDQTLLFVNEMIAENSDYTFRFHERISPVSFQSTKTAIEAVDDLNKSVSPTVSPYLAMSRQESLRGR